TVTYTPAAVGTFSFTYTVQDNQIVPLTSNVATVTVNVAAADTPPVANNDAAVAVIGTPVTISVLANDTSATSTINPATVVVASQPASGSATANGNGTITYTPGLAGTYTFTYTVKDNYATPAT